MGFFSTTCAKSHLPVCSSHRQRPFFSEVVALLPDGSILEGEYDGYGRVNEVQLVDDWEKVKFVLKAVYAGEKYKDLGKSYDEKAQGWFMDDEFLDVCEIKGSFASHKEYQLFFDKFAKW